MTTPPAPSASDRNVEAVILKHRQRAARGLEKYGVTTERTDLTTPEWFQHCQDELMDAAVYLEVLMGRLESAARPAPGTTPEKPATVFEVDKLAEILCAKSAEPPLADRVGDALTREVERRTAELRKERDDWKAEWEMWDTAWVRELGGVIRHKTHRIDALVLTTRDLREKAEAAGPPWPAPERVPELAKEYLKLVAIGEQLAWASRLVHFFEFVRERERAGKGGPAKGVYVEPGFGLPPMVVSGGAAARLGPDGRPAPVSAPGDEAAREAEQWAEWMVPTDHGNAPYIIKITNRSAWPDWFIRPLVAYIAERANVQPTMRGDPRTILVRSTTRPHTWDGWCCGREVMVLLHRRCNWRWSKDSRFKWGPKYDLPRGPVAMLAFLLAHEMYHWTPENRAHFTDRRDSAGRRNRDFAEFKTNEWAMATVRALAADWPAFRARVAASQRAARCRAAAVDQRRAGREAQAKSPDARISLQRAKLVRWETKAKRAETACRKLRRSIAALERGARRVPPPGRGG